MNPTEVYPDQDRLEKAVREGELEIPDPNNVSMHAARDDGKPDSFRATQIKLALPQIRRMYERNRAKAVSRGTEAATREWTDAAQHIANMAIAKFLESLPASRREAARRNIFPVRPENWVNMFNGRPMFFS